METTPRENESLDWLVRTDDVADGDTDADEAAVSVDVVDRTLVFGDGCEPEPMAATGWRELAGASVDIDVEDVVATDDREAMGGTVSNSSRETSLTLAPTGDSFPIPYVWFCQIDNERIAEVWSLHGGLGPVQQLGAVLGRTSPFMIEPNDRRTIHYER